VSRHEYRLGLSGREPHAVAAVPDARMPTPADREALARLMLEAYRGTIDDEGESLDEAREEVDAWLASAPLLDGSRVLGTRDGALISAVLVSRLGDLPIIAYAMTAPPHTARGLASALLSDVVASLAAQGERAVVAFITEGNLLSERVFTRAGFERLPTVPEVDGVVDDGTLDVAPTSTRAPRAWPSRASSNRSPGGSSTSGCTTRTATTSA
jgi:RimJ/RimL family protein N-acetyltransferase